MSLEFSEKNLNEVYSITSGLSKSSDEFGFGFPFLSFKTIFYNYYIVDELDELVNSTKEEQTKHSVKKGDVFLTRTSETLDELGMSCVALRDYPNATFNGFTKRLRPKKDKVIYPLYACYYFRSPLFRKYVDSMAIMTTRASLNNNILSKLPIIFPDYQEQKKIGHLLYNLDKKIELNKKINKNLTKLSSSIFINLMEKSNEFLELNECCKFIKGKKPKETSEYPQSNFLDYLTIDVLSNQSQMYAYDEKGILANEYDILMVMDGASSGKLFYGKSGIVGSTLAKLNVEEKYLEIVYQFLKQSEKFISDNTTGSAIPHTDKGLVLNLKCPISDELLNYSATFKSMRSTIIKNNNEILKLQKLRDTLLPKLMSGEIDVSKINCDFENIAHFMIFSFKKIIGYLGLYFIRFL